jgi:hypothetical protein
MKSIFPFGLGLIFFLFCGKDRIRANLCIFFPVHSVMVYKVCSW